LTNVSMNLAKNRCKQKQIKSETAMMINQITSRCFLSVASQPRIAKQKYSCHFWSTSMRSLN